jgi:predicted nucleic acid-binding protein
LKIVTRLRNLYVDTNAFVYAFEGNDEQLGLALQRLFAKLGPLAMTTSELTLSEMLVKPYQNGETERVRRYKALFQLAGNGFMKVVPVGTEVLSRAAGHRATQKAHFNRKLSLPDAIHLATADFWGCTHFMTNDDRIWPYDDLTMLTATISEIEHFMLAFPS